MHTDVLTTAELMMEVRLDDRSRRIFRTLGDHGKCRYIEVSDLIDFSRPIAEADEFAVFDDLNDCWAATLGYLSADGLLTRTVWHIDLHEWASLSPIFIHAELRSTIYTDLAALVNSLSLEEIGRCSRLPQWMALVTGGRVADVEEKQQHEALLAA